MTKGYSKFFKVVKMIQEVETEYSTQNKITCADDAANFSKSKIQNLAYEVTGAILLDSSHRPVGWSIFAQGTIDQCAASPREVFTQALLSGASAVIIFHNHPSGDSHPSRADIEFTQRIKKAGKLLGIRVIDHLVIGNDVFSLADNGMMRKD